jgi:excinuclease ABC subunit A
MKYFMGSLGNVRIDKELVHTSTDYFLPFDGLIKYLEKVLTTDDSAASRRWAEQFMATTECPECHGLRLNREALSYKIWNENIAQVTHKDIDELKTWLDQVKEHMEPKQQKNC